MEQKLPASLWLLTKLSWRRLSWHEQNLFHVPLNEWETKGLLKVHMQDYYPGR